MQPGLSEVFASPGQAAGVLGVLLHADPGDAVEPLTYLRMVTGWQWDGWVGVPLLIALGGYLWGVHVLRRRGDAWPRGRTLAWCLGGVGTIALATLSFLGRYDTVLFSVHMVQHMILNMVSPIFLAEGAPVTLALRTLPAHWRSRLVRLLHSGAAKVLVFPPLTTALMIGMPFALYQTSFYRLTLENDLVHNLLHIWFLTVGCLFAWPLLGVDPMPFKVPYPLRILLYFLTMPFHAFAGIMIMGSGTLVAEDWYLAFNRAWGPSPLDDQYLAGGILWATGDLTMLSTMTAIFVQWFRDSQREARQIDRRLDREEAVAARAAAGMAARYDASGEEPSHHEQSSDPAASEPTASVAEEIRP